MSKNVISHCTHCDLAIEQDRMPTALRRKADQLKMNSKGPLWRFAGFAILVGIGALGFLQIALDNAQDRGYIEEPMVGDVYVYEIDPRAYSTFKAVQVYPDSVDIVMNNYQVGSQYASRQIDKPGNYSDSIRRLARNDLADLYVTGEVVDIERNARIEVWDFIR